MMKDKAMKAWVLHGIADLRLENVEVPKPGKGEVLVAVKAAGICGSDIPRIYRTGTYTFPTIPGHEFAGVVAEIGEGVSPGWQGKHVGVYPLIPCRNCVPCRKKQYEMCRQYGYLGSRTSGGFAEYVTVPADNLIALPKGLSFEEAAILEPMAVAAHALRRIELTDRNTIVVCGLGTIGLMLLMLIREALEDDDKQKTADRTLDGQILAIGNKASQKQVALAMGFSEDCYCDSRVQDVGRWLEERTNGIGADAFFECVGRNETISLAVDHAAPSGKVLLMGNPYTDIRFDKSVYWKILRNQLTVMGTWNSSFTHDGRDDWNYILDRLSDHKITPDKFISHRFSLMELEKGLHIMRDKTEDYVKVMGVW